MQNGFSKPIFLWQDASGVCGHVLRRLFYLPAAFMFLAENPSTAELAGSPAARVQVL
jgi:hypothetical protein